MSSAARSTLVLTLMLALASYVSPSGIAASPSGEPVQVGVLCSFSGPETVTGTDMIRGIQMATDEINASGGIDGRPLKFIPEDIEYRADVAVDAVHKLIDVNKVPVILMCGGSGAMIPVAQYAKDKDVIVINTAASSPKLREYAGTIFSVVPLDDIVGKNLGDWVYASGHKTAVTVVPNNPYGLGVQDAVAAAFTAAGGKILGKVAYDEGKSDYRPELQRVQGFRPDAIISATYGDDGKLLLKQARQLGMKTPWYTTYPDIINVGDPQDANGVLCGVDLSARVGETFRSQYVARFGHAPDNPWAATAYDGLWLVALAMRQGGLTASDVRSGLPKVAATYVGATGKVVWDKTFQRTNYPLQRFCYTAGKLRPVR
jgi:branched-chain amino acid transport system substrate-binding protein